MARNTIVNPILRGFNPDPSICRVGEDYYIATSTFEWYPGVQIHHSRDLANWRLAARPLNREALLDMRGNPDSGGVWAPCLTWSDGLFYLVYSDVKRLDGNLKDSHNYLSTCETIDGDWSDPVYLNSSGFDASLFHGDDGRKWLLNMVWDHRAQSTPQEFFRGIALQEYCVDQQRLIGQRRLIFEGTELGFVEAPHLYRREGYYYLITAEGGTGYGHAVTLARSRTIEGPYEADPAGPVVTSRDAPDWPLQRAGHGDLVETPDGQWYLVYLVSRPLPGRRLSPLGRETAIARVEWTDEGWLRLEGGGSLPPLELEGPVVARSPVDPESERDDFDAAELAPVYQWLRTPHPREFMSLEERPGYLRLYGMESPGSWFRQALIARRQTAFAYEVATGLDFLPDNFQQLAGLILYYDASKFHYLYLSHDESLGRVLGIMSCEGSLSCRLSYPMGPRPVVLPPAGTVHLRARVDGERIRFAWSLDDKDWTDLPAEVDGNVLSDEAGRGGGASFTGTFVGVCCHDVSGSHRHADFDHLTYRPLT